MKWDRVLATVFHEIGENRVVSDIRVFYNMEDALSYYDPFFNLQSGAQTCSSTSLSLTQSSLSSC